eukprot:3098517-Pyramimonas_sp.AAC.1
MNQVTISGSAPAQLTANYRGAKVRDAESPPTTSEAFDATSLGKGKLARSLGLAAAAQKGEGSHRLAHAL